MLDVTFTHSRSSMAHLCTAYTLLIKVLINEVQSEERILAALTTVREYSQMNHVDAIVNEFFEMA